MNAMLQPHPRGAPLERALDLDATLWADPHAAHALLREAGPLHWSEAFFGGAWLVTRHADAEQVLRDPRFSARRTGGWVREGSVSRGEFGAFQRLFARALLFVDAPNHGRLRALMQAGFTRSSLAGLQPWIEQRCSQMLDTLEACLQQDPAAPVDFMQHLARPLPASVIARLLGLPAGDEAEVMAWSSDLAVFIGSPRPGAAAKHRAQRGLLAMADYFTRAFVARHHNPGAGLLGGLLQAQADGRLQGAAELLAQCTMLLFAGHETTRNLLGNTVQALLDHPAQWHRLQQEPALLPAAVREVLRYDSPVQYTGRRVAVPMTLHGQALRRGDAVIVLIGAANRDPRRHERPDVFDIARDGCSSLAFGSGAHVCIGAALSLMEAEVVLGQLLQRWPRLRLARNQPDRLAGPTLFRGLNHLPLWLDDPLAGVP